MGKKKHFKCVSEEQKKAIRASYARKAKEEQFPAEFPFWARLKLSKGRTTLVIDEEEVQQDGKVVDCFVHREAIHESEKNKKRIHSKDYEEIYPNPDKNDPKPMYLKRPTKRSKKDFVPHNKKLDMPEYLKNRYEVNNKKKK